MLKKILVVDDENAITRGFVLAFKGLDYQLDTATSGEEGLTMIQKERYDLVFIDLAMPHMSGIDVLKKIRKADKDLPVYIITGYYREFCRDLKKAEIEGLDFELIQKPFGPEKVLMIAEEITRGLPCSSAINSKFVFKLFVAGKTEKNEDMTKNLNRFLAQHLKEHCDFETIDILAKPEPAEFYNVFATPTLMKVEPDPARSIVGDLSSLEKVNQWMTSIGC